MPYLCCLMLAVCPSGTFCPAGATVATGCYTLPRGVVDAGTGHAVCGACTEGGYYGPSTSDQPCTGKRTTLRILRSEVLAPFIETLHMFSDLFRFHFGP